MQLEDYFDRVNPDEIVVRGTRVGLEVILHEYFAGNLPEEIASSYPSLSLEQVHAAITYYLRNRTELDDYYRRWTTRGDAVLAARNTAPSSLLDRIRQTEMKTASR